MKKTMSMLGLVLLAFWAMPAVAGASAVIVSGNTCPPSPLPSGFSNQYTMTAGLFCTYDDNTNPASADSNIVGTTAEANTYLNAFPTQIGTGWIGLGQQSGAAGATSGTFTYSGPAVDQIAVGIKDGSLPFFAIFVLPAGTFSSTWSMTGGSLSHFAVYGRNVTPDTRTGGQTLVPEPASLLLLGTGLSLVAARVRNRNKRRQ